MADGTNVITTTTPDPVDTYVGARIRARRRTLKISQETLAAALGITFQQIQKYERGANRVSSSKLWAIAIALQCQVGHFFEGLERGPEATQAEVNAVMVLTTTEHGLELAEAFQRLTATARKALLQCAVALSGKGA